MATINILPNGYIFGDRYRIVRLLGQGGMGVVYLAEDTKLNNELRALKTVRPELLNNKKNAKRFKNEALASMRLTHKNIVRVYNYEEFQGFSFIVMEYVEGDTLADILVDEEKFTVDKFNVLSAQICDALQFAHEEKVLHQDIKPENIFLNSEGVIKLADFGIARLLADTATRLTGNLPSGTLTHMSPELLQGEKPDIASEIYMLGITFYELLSGEPPFVRGDIYRQHIEKIPRPVESIPEPLNDAILSALAKDPEDRPSSVADFDLLLSGARKAKTESLASRPEDIQNRSKELSGGKLYQQGRAAMKAESPQEAKALFERAIKADHHLIEIIQPDLDTCQQELNRIETEHQAEQELQAERTRIPAFLVAAERLMNKGELQKAEEYYQKILNVDTANAEASLKLGEIEKLRVEKALENRKEEELRIARIEEQRKTSRAESERAYQEEQETKRRALVEVKRKRQEHIRRHWWKYAGVLAAIIGLVVFLNMQAEHTRLTQLERTAFEHAQKLETITSWKTFLSEFPASEHKAEASSRIEELQAQADIAFKQSELENTIQGWREYIENWPGAKQIELAKSNLSNVEGQLNEAEAIAYSQAKRTDTKSEWEAFLKKYPLSSNTIYASKRILEIQTKTQLQTRGERTNELKKAATEAFNNALGIDSISGWNTFLNDYPNSPNSSIAKSKLSTLQKADKRRKAEGDKFRSLVKMVRIKAGSYMMGMKNGNGDEEPVHRVYISKDFYMGIYEVTLAEYEAVTGERPSRFKGYNYPVERVSWNDAQEFCRILSQLSGQKYRLPTEAEWEYAARAGTSTAYYWGQNDSNADTYAWFVNNSGSLTHPVGRKQPNAWGLYDISGNVGEWCHDWYGEYSKGPVTDPNGEQNGSLRINRGGSWVNVSRGLKSANRNKLTPSSRYGNIGFRVVRELN